MLVSKVIEYVQEAELKQTSVKDDKPAIMRFINLGVLEIYKRFDLYRQTAVITMVDGTTTYALDGVDANVAMDLTDHDLVMVLEVEDVDGEPLSINKESDDFGIKMPIYNQVMPKTLVDGDTISLVYKATPKFITSERDEVNLPPQFLEALFNYVGYRGHGSIKGDLNSENSSHYKRFNQSLQRVAALGLFTQDDMSSEMFDARGFV